MLKTRDRPEWHYGYGQIDFIVGAGSLDYSRIAIAIILPKAFSVEHKIEAADRRQYDLVLLLELWIRVSARPPPFRSS